MNCTSCGKSLPTGVAFCPSCGTSTPYNMPGQGATPAYDPTEASSPGSSQNYPSLPPMPAANPDQQVPQFQSPNQNPYTNYGPGIPSPTPYPPYNTPPTEYAGIPQSPANPVDYAPYNTPGYPPGMQPGTYAVPPKKRSRVGWIVGISLLVAVLLCGGLIVAVTLVGKNAATAIKSSTSTTATGSVPTSNDIAPAAAQILFRVQTSSAISSNYNPTQVTNTFATGKDVNLTFHVDSAGKNGYIKVKWYEDGQQVDSNILTHHAPNDHGYFAESFTSAGSGAAALYWCTKSDCSDEQLAQVVTFTITETSTVISPTNIVTEAGWKHNNA